MIPKTLKRTCTRTQVKTTQRYAHLDQATLIDAANAAMNAVGRAFMPIPVPMVQITQPMAL